MVNSTGPASVSATTDISLDKPLKIWSGLIEICPIICGTFGSLKICDWPLFSKVCLNEVPIF